jgi:hypothetical protein
MGWLLWAAPRAKWEMGVAVGEHVSPVWMCGVTQGDRPWCTTPVLSHYAHCWNFTDHHTHKHTHTHTHTHTRGPAVVNAPILPLALLLQPPQMWACPQGINKSSHKNIEVICLDSLNWQHCSLTRWCGVWVVSSPALLCLSPVSQK